MMLTLLLLIALGYDIATRRIPNWLVLTGLLAGIGYSLLVAAGQPDPLRSLLGAVTGLAVMLPLYFFRTMGAGDIKLMAAVGAFLGPLPVLGAALLTFAAGGVLALLAAFGSRSWSRVFDNLRLMGVVVASGRASGLSLRDVQTTGRLPYAIAIAIGTGLQLWLAARGHWPFV